MVWFARVADQMGSRGKDGSMNAIKTWLRVDENRSVSGVVPDAVPAGEHEVTITVASPRPEPRFFHVSDLPVHDVPWDGSISLRRDDIYDCDGR